MRKEENITPLGWEHLRTNLYGDSIEVRRLALLEGGVGGSMLGDNMKNFQYVLFQIDEAKRHLAEGSLPALRVALLLLDNAVEVILDRWIEEDLYWDCILHKLQHNARAVRSSKTHEVFEDLLKAHFLSDSEVSKVSRFFDEKIRYVTVIKNIVPASVGEILSHLHRYRNAAYHSGRVKPQILSSLIMILLKLCCQLISLLSRLGLNYSSSDDYSWIEKRFALKPQAFLNPYAIDSVLSIFRENIPIGDTSLRQTLALNFSDRVEEVQENLEFIASENRTMMDTSTALLEAQKYTLSELKIAPHYGGMPKKLGDPVSLAQLEAFCLVPDQIRCSQNSVAAFEIYASSDVELERIEFMVDHLARFIDEITQ